MQSKFLADNIQFLFFYYFSEKNIDILCESSARQMIHKKCQALFSLENEQKL